MNWRFKSRVLRAVAVLPAPVVDPLYQRLIARFGRTYDLHPIRQMVASTELCRLWEKAGGSAVDARFLEIGTGWRVAIPMALWVRGARSITCVDIRRLVNDRTLRSDLDYIREHPQEVEQTVDGRFQADRLRALVNIGAGTWRRDDLFRLCNIDYHAPCDAARLPFDASSFDCQMSYATLEHIPPDWLRAVVMEARRVLRPGGVALHRIDLGDHFSYTDPSLSPLNFLRFDEPTWRTLGGHRYVYMNRLRIDDYLRMFEECGFRVTACERYQNPRGVEQLRDLSFKVDQSFRGKSEEDLATTSAWVMLENP